MHVCNSSGILNSSGAVVTRPCFIHAVTLTQASAACTVTVYDNASAASGTVVAQADNTTNNTTVNGPQLPYPVRCNAGAYVAITGTGATAILYYELG